MKILFLDMDGTVLSHTQGKIPLSALQAIEKVQRKGIYVYGCTGRHLNELKQLPIQELKLDGWITTNGSLNYKADGTLLSDHPIEKETIYYLYEALKKDPFPVQFIEEKEMYMNMHSKIVEEYLAKIHSVQDPLQPLERILENNIYMFIPWVKEDIFQKLKKHLVNVNCVRWNDYALDCIHINSGKQKGIEDVLQYHHLKKEDASSVGDGDNDFSMFQACGLNVAMGNASEELKKHADFVTTHIDEDGLANAIEYLLNKQSC